MNAGQIAVERAWTAPLRRLVFGHFLAAAAEWGVFIGAFVFAFQSGGASATGLASILLLGVTVVASPLAGLAVAKWQPNITRLFSLASQAIGCLTAGTAALLDGPLLIVLAGSSLTLATFTLIRPSQAILLPLLCERPRQLTTTSLRMGHADSSAALFGPLASTGLMLISGPGAVFVGFGLALALASGLQLVDQSLGRSERKTVVDAPRIADVVVAPFRQLRARGGLLSLIGLVMFQYGLVGALDILFVVITLETLQLDESVVSLLTSFFGAGAMGAVALSSLAHRRNRLAVSLSAGLLACGLVVGGLALMLSSSSASLTPLLIGLPILGAARFLVLVVSRALLQRSADDDTLGSVFALMEFGSGIGILLGSIVAQVTLALGGPALTLGVFAGAYFVMLAGTWRAVRQAESSATVPLVEMGLLRKIPAFTPLPPMALEAVARTAELVDVAADERVICQGDDGDRFFAVVNGSFDVVMNGRYVRTATRGDSFGEVALLANVERTADVTATEASTMLAIAQEPFLLAVASHDSARTVMWGTIAEMELDEEIISVAEAASLSTSGEH